MKKLAVTLLAIGALSTAAVAHSGCGVSYGCGSVGWGRTYYPSSYGYGYYPSYVGGSYCYPRYRSYYRPYYRSYGYGYYPYRSYGYRYGGYPYRYGWGGPSIGLSFGFGDRYYGGSRYYRHHRHHRHHR